MAVLEIETKGFDRLSSLPAVMGELVRKAMLPALFKGVEDVATYLVKALPVGATGQLRRSIQKEMNLAPVFDFSARIFTTLKYATYVELGRPPGKMPPVSELEQWAKQRGLNPWAVAKSIQAHGTIRYRMHGPGIGEWANTRRNLPQILAPAAAKAGTALGEAIGKHLNG